MTKRIFKAVCTAALGVFVVTLLLIMGVLYEYFSTVRQSQLMSQTILASRGVEKLGMDYFDGLNTDHFRITWIAANGDVLYDSITDTDAMDNHVEREEIRQALNTGTGESSRYSSTLMKRYLYSARRLSDGTVLRLSVTQNTIFVLLIGMLQPILIVIAVAAVLSFVLANGLSKRIVEPLNRLNLDEPLNNEGYDELTPLLRRIYSQQQQLIAQAEQDEQRRREFTANVSHELKTPLQSISGYSEILACGMAKPEDVKPFAGRIYSEAQRLISLVEDIISLSHLDAGTGYARKEVDLYCEAQKVVEKLSGIAAENGVALHLNGESSVINGIPELVHGIIYNLCDNAIKYNRPNGSVTVIVTKNSLTVRDTGIGIPQEDLDRIFERFYRVDKSRSKEVGGTGLGLSIVKHAAMLMNAVVSVESKVDEGTQISVTFPDDSQ